VGLPFLGTEDHHMDVAAWLRRLGLERYAPAFRDNDVDGEVLPELTSDDLISIAVTSVGHRRKLLAAIASLSTALPTAKVMAVPRDASARAGAERQQLTVMFCDLVGSTPLSVRFDPEDLRELIGAYHRCVADTVARFSGFVAKYMGDRVRGVTPTRYSRSSRVCSALRQWRCRMHSYRSRLRTAHPRQ
jgi:hypothetical protein